jgi:hypothetical protein
MEALVEMLEVSALQAPVAEEVLPPLSHLTTAFLQLQAAAVAVAVLEREVQMHLLQTLHSQQMEQALVAEMVQRQ